MRTAARGELVGWGRWCPPYQHLPLRLAGGRSMPSGRESGGPCTGGDGLLPAVEGVGQGGAPLPEPPARSCGMGRSLPRHGARNVQDGGMVGARRLGRRTSGSSSGAADGCAGPNVPSLDRPTPHLAPRPSPPQGHFYPRKHWGGQTAREQNDHLRERLVAFAALVPPAKPSLDPRPEAARRFPDHTAARC